MSLIHLSDLKKAVSGKRLLIDTNIIVYLTDSITPYNTLSSLLFEMIEKGEAAGIISIISVAEIMRGPLKNKLTQNAMDVKKYLMNFPNISCQDITGAVLECMGVQPRIDWAGLRTIDSVIIASGLINNVDLIVSNDFHFKKALPKEFILTFDK
jgi:predicted nucleic acid-binding protein